MKKIIGVILAAVMLLSMSVIPAFAAEDSGLTEAVKSVKSRIDIPDGYKDFTSHKNEEDGGITYDLFWRDGGKEIRVSILGNGRITDFYKYDDSVDYNVKGIAKFTAEQFAGKAEEFVKRANPDMYGQLVLPAETGSASVDARTVNVTFKRAINGIPVKDNFISVYVDKFTGSVESMYMVWQDHKTVAEADKVIGAEEAEKALADKIDFVLCYRRPSGSDTAIPVYCANNRYVMIDAFTGREFTVSIDEDDSGANGGGADAPEPAPREENSMADKDAGLTEEEIKEIGKMDSLISKKEIEKKIAGMTDTALSSYKITSIGYTREQTGEDEYSYVANVTLNGGTYKYAYVRFDAEDGKLLSLYVGGKYDNESALRYSEKQRRTIADRFVKTLASDISDKLNVYDDEDAKYGYFSYLRTENGVRYDENCVSVRVDGVTGKVTSFSRNWDDDVEFASVDGIIDAETARAKFFAEGPVLTYVANGMKYYYHSSAREAALVYMVSDDAPAYIDAATGKAYDWSLGVDEEKNYTLQKDLDGHFAKEAVKILAENGVVFTYDDNFRPNDAITQKEALLFIEQLGGSYRYTPVDYKSVLDSCIREGIIDEKEKNPDLKINRETAACYIVRSLGFRKAAEIKGIYNAGFKDSSSISADKVGYIAIARGLGIMNGDKAGMANPKKEVTRGEFAVMLYNLLKK